jgi:hypothetical protein
MAVKGKITGIFIFTFPGSIKYIGTSFFKLYLNFIFTSMPIQHPYIKL